MTTRLQRLVSILVVLAIFAVVVALLLPARSSHDRWRGFSSTEREIGKSIENRGVLYVYLPSREIIVFRIPDSQRVTDQSLERLSPKILEELTFASSEFSQRIGLTLADSQVTDAGMVQVSQYKMLRHIDLPRAVGDAGMSQIAQMTELEDLDISSTKVTDAGLKILAALTNLRSLKLPMSITNDGLRELQVFKELEYLSILDITDAGLKNLPDLKYLSHLSICSSDVSDTGLEHLRRFSRLNQLGLTGTRVTELAASKLKSDIPGIVIYLQGGPGPARTIQ